MDEDTYVLRSPISWAQLAVFINISMTSKQRQQTVCIVSEVEAGETPTIAPLTLVQASSSFNDDDDKIEEGQFFFS